MRVEYYRKIIEALIDKGCKEADIARAIQKSRTAVNTMRGKNKNQLPPEDLKGSQLAGLIKLCKSYKIEPKTWNALGKRIEAELRKA